MIDRNGLNATRNWRREGGKMKPEEEKKT